MGVASDILKKRTNNRKRLEQEAPDLFNGFNELVGSRIIPASFPGLF